MKKSRSSDGQIMGILKQAESGVPIAELCREHGMSSASFYKWRAKYGGMDTSLMAEMKALSRENQRLKRMFDVCGVKHAERVAEGGAWKKALRRSAGSPRP